MIRTYTDNLRRINGYPGLHGTPTGATAAGRVVRAAQNYARQHFAAPRNAALPHRTGKGTFIGSVKTKGAPDLPVVRPVVVFDHASRLPLAQTLSAPDGSYRFGGLPTAPVFVVSFDPAGVHRAVIADNLIPEVAP